MKTPFVVKQKRHSSVRLGFSEIAVRLRHQFITQRD